jgi:hypothetical protein
MQPDNPLDRQINDAVDQVWRLLVDLTVEQKAVVIERLQALLAMEEASHESLQ